MLALQVYQKHCIQDLAAYPKRLRECALHTLANPNALQWALEMCGFKEANIAVKDNIVDQSPDGSFSSRHQQSHLLHLPHIVTAMALHMWGRMVCMDLERPCRQGYTL